MSLGHKKLSAWYLQLAQNLDAGLPLAQALRGAGGLPATTTDAMVRWIEAGGSVAHALHLAKNWLPTAESPALLAAASSGRLPSTLRRLSDRHSQLYATKLSVALNCAYPVFLLHLALLIFPLLRMTDWGHGLHWSTSTYFLTLAALLVPLWGGALWLGLLFRLDHPFVARLADFLPGVRGYLRAQALSEFTFTLGHLLDAGVIIAEAWAVAGQTSRSPALRRAGQALHDLAVSGEAPGLHLHHFPCFPTDYVSFYRAGEINGQLDHNLRLIAGQCQERAVLGLKLATKIYSTLLFLFVAGSVGYMVISYYIGYFQLLNHLSA